MRLKKLLAVPMCLLWTVGTLLGVAWVTLSVPALAADPAAKARGTGHDAMWLSPVSRPGHR